MRLSEKVLDKTVDINILDMALFMKAIELAKNRYFLEAIDKLTELTVFNPSFTDAYYQRGHCKELYNISKGELIFDPLEDYLKAIEVNPAFPWGWYYIGIKHTNIDTKKAKEYIKYAQDLFLIQQDYDNFSIVESCLKNFDQNLKNFEEEQNKILGKIKRFFNY